MKKTKVCILQNGLTHGGTDTFVVNLCKGLDKGKYDITVVNPELRPEKRVREKDVIDTGAKILQTHPLIGLKGKLIHFVQLFKILRNGKYDVFQTNIDLFNGPNLFVAWLAGVPVRCCHSHNAMQQKSLTNGMTMSIRIYQSIMKWLCWHFSNRRCGCSEKAMDFLYYGRNWNDVAYPAIINNGIDISRFRLPVRLYEKKCELGLTNKHHIITVGRIIPQKNPVFLAAVVSDFLLKHESYDMIWIGNGPLENDCREKFESYGLSKRVHFFSKREDVNEVLKCSDLFFMPSIFEGLPYALVEAQASGLRCLVSDGIDRAVDCGGCYFMSIRENVEKWSRKMEEILNGEIELSIEEKKIQEYSVERMVEQMEKVFKK